MSKKTQDNATWTQCKTLQAPLMSTHLTPKEFASPLPIGPELQLKLCSILFVAPRMPPLHHRPIPKLQFILRFIEYASKLFDSLLYFRWPLLIWLNAQIVPLDKAHCYIRYMCLNFVDVHIFIHLFSMMHPHWSVSHAWTYTWCSLIPSIVMHFNLSLTCAHARWCHVLIVLFQWFPSMLVF